MQFATSIVDQLGHLQRYLLTPSRSLGRATCLVPLIGAAITVGFPPPAYGQGTGVIEIEFVEENADEIVPCRVQILDSRGRPLRARGALFHQGWNLIEESLLYKGRPGEYTYRAYHGPQFASASGGFTLDRKAEGYDIVHLPRHADLEMEGWIGADLLCFDAPAKLKRWLPAEDLFMAVHVDTDYHQDAPDTLANPPSHAVHVEQHSFLDDRRGSGLVLHHWHPPAAVPKELPSSRLLVLAKDSEADDLPVVAEIQRLDARDAPVWLASGRIDAIQVLSNHQTIDGKGSRPQKPFFDPDPGRFRGPTGQARLIEYLYWKVLDAGFRLPPTAGSGFGKVPSPLGYNRVYAVPGSVSVASWWNGLLAGRAFVTNGPLLRTRINGALPGEVFHIGPGDSLALDVALTLTVRDPVEYVDVIFNGSAIYEAKLSEYAKQGGKIPPLSVDESGWIIVRVVTQRTDTYRLAMSAPFYVEVDQQPRISKSAVELFSRWLESAATNSQGQPGHAAAEPYLESAKKFWDERLGQANAP